VRKMCIYVIKQWTAVTVFVWLAEVVFVYMLR